MVGGSQSSAFVWHGSDNTAPASRHPAVRVPGPEGGLASKQLTLAYTETAEEAAVARDLATLWSWHQVAAASGGATQPAPRLNWPLARYGDGRMEVAERFRWPSPHTSLLCYLSCSRTVAATACRFQEQAALMQRLRGIATAAGVQELAKELRDSGALDRLATAWTAGSPSAGQASPPAAAAGAAHGPSAGNLLAALEAAAEEAQGVSEVSGALSPSSG